MRALMVKGPGEAPMIDEVPEPVLTDSDQVLVRVQAASLSRLDSYTVRGLLDGVLECVYPIVLGWDFAGVVERVGDAVQGFAVGDAVMGILHRTALHVGTIAEKVLISVTPYSLAHRPAGLDVTAAAAVPFAGHAAYGCIAAASLQPADRVLVVGACGGVGGFVVQLAAARGAHVIAAGCSDDAGYLRELGAAEVLDYRADLAAQLRKASPGGIDVLIDTVSGEGERHVAFDAIGAQVKEGGRIVSTAMIADVGHYLAQGVHAVNLMADISPGCSLAEVTGLLGTGRIPRLQVCDLDAAPDTMKGMETQHTVGKYVIRI